MAGWIVVVIALLGLIPLVLVFWKNQQIKKLMKTGELVTGVVEDMEQRFGMKGNRYYRAVIRYTPMGMSTIRVVHLFTSPRHLPQLAKGNEVALYYNKENPEKFILRDVPRGRGFLVFSIIVAVSFIVISYFLYAYMKKSSL